MYELNLVSTEDIIKELVRRTDNIVIVGEKILDSGKAELIQTIDGDPIKCLGLIEVIKPSMMPDILGTNHEE